LKAYNLFLREAISTLEADVSKDATTKEPSPLATKGCPILVDQLTVKKERAAEQLIVQSKLFLKEISSLMEHLTCLKLVWSLVQNHDEYDSMPWSTITTLSVLMMAARSTKRGTTRMAPNAQNAH
jgi:hypothetical protein